MTSLTGNIDLDLTSSGGGGARKGFEEAMWLRAWDACKKASLACQWHCDWCMPFDMPGEVRKWFIRGGFLVERQPTSPNPTRPYCYRFSWRHMYQESMLANLKQR